MAFSKVTLLYITPHRRIAACAAVAELDIAIVMMNRRGRYIFNLWHVSGHIPLVASQLSASDGDVAFT